MHGSSWVPWGTKTAQVELKVNECKPLWPGSGLSGGGGGGGGGMGSMPAGAFGTFGDHGGGGGKKRANVILQVLDFGKAQWERVAKKSFPNGGAVHREPAHPDLT